MTLEKRELTLNEADSLKDTYYLEKTLLEKYLEGEKYAERKEARNELEKLTKQAEEDKKHILSLWQKAKNE